MTETTFLAGKVVKRSLPLVEPTDSNAPNLKRLLLPQGELAQLYNGDEGMRYVALIELRAGSVRGNHYHEVKQEFLYVIEGEVVLVVEDIDSKERASIPLRTGDMAFVPIRIAHALQVARSGQALEFSSARFDPADIQRVALV